MHEVGRTYAKRHDVTLENLYRYVPRSNDPGCSAGFGMGMGMYLGPELIVLRPGPCLATAPTADAVPRVHVYARLGSRFHARLPQPARRAIQACIVLGPANAPDCAQGAFHDYWISLGGGDGTRPAREQTPTRPVPLRPLRVHAALLVPLLLGTRSGTHRVYHRRRSLDALRRPGRNAAGRLHLRRLASRVANGSPWTMRGLRGVCQACSTLNCLRGVDVPALDGNRFEQLGLIRTCGGLPRETRCGCFSGSGGRSPSSPTGVLGEPAATRSRSPTRASPASPAGPA